MNYLKVYCNLIRKAENRTPPEGCVERHHTFPKSIFGDNDRIVVLTPREHYIAHLLLEKIYIKRYGIGDKNTKKMTITCVMMRNRSEKYNSHLYEQVRKRHSENMKERMSGERNPFYGKTHTQKTRDIISFTHKNKTISKEQKDYLSEIFSGEGNPFYGKTHTKETRDLISVKNKGKIPDDKQKEYLSKIFSGEGNPFYGKNHSEKSIAEMRKNSVKYLYEIKDPEGNIYITDNLNYFCKMNGLDTAAMQRVCFGKQKSHTPKRKDRVRNKIGWTVKILEQIN